MIPCQTYHPEEVDFDIHEIMPRHEPRKVLLCTPDYFDIVDVKNIHMEGHVGILQKNLATEQWLKLKDIYESLVTENILEKVYIIDGAEGCEDMVFAANQSFPWLLQEKKVVVMSRMRHPSRQREVPYFEDFYRRLGYEILHLKQAHYFEGMGDTIPHHGKNLLYGGYGHRSDITAFDELAQLLQVPIVALPLLDERFYHLDTCFMPIDEETLLLCPAAFTQEGLTALRRLFNTIVEIPETEAATCFALNAHCINDPISKKKRAIIQKGTVLTKKVLEQYGYQVIETDTSEYIKSGGSVFCMKMMLY